MADGRPQTEVERPPASAPAAAAAPAPTDAAQRRRVERLPSGRPAAGRRPAAPQAWERIEETDAAIPFELVPYVPADLRRVGIMAALMIVLIVVANVVVSHVAG